MDIGGVIIERGVPLKALTTFGIGGPADVVYPESTEQLVNIADTLRGRGERFWVIGGGSNVLAADEGVGGVVVGTKKMYNVQCTTYNGGRYYVTCECGVMLPRLAAVARDGGLTGLEWAAGIPATVGGATAGNAGAYGGCMAGIVRGVSVWLDGRVIRLSNAECRFGYRDSIFKRGKGIILSAEIALRLGDRERIAQIMAENAAKRREAQPSGKSAGSVFKKCGDVSAGYLIETAGLKGLKIGGAEVSQKHANFIINSGGATARDVYGLIEAAAGKVLAMHGARLEPEIIFFCNKGDISYDTGRLPYAFCF